MKSNSFRAEDAVRRITRELVAVSDSPRLDAELLTAMVLQRSRSWLFANPQQLLSDSQQQQLQQITARRINGEPMAYILGYQEFWGLHLTVTPGVLIPRPETEHIVEWALENFPANFPLKIADLGTGSGAIALALAVERPQWQIDATDQSLSALEVARFNAAHHPLTSVNFYQSDWCVGLPSKNYALIISNPPYIAAEDTHLPLLKYEPQSALVSGADGLHAIRTIISQAPEYLAESGYLVLEHGYDQAPAVAQLLHQNGFANIQSHLDLAQHPRFTTARLGWG